MFGLILKALSQSLLTIGPELFLFIGAPELPRRRRFVTVRQGRRVRLETV